MITAENKRVYEEAVGVIQGPPNQINASRFRLITSLQRIAPTFKTLPRPATTKIRVYDVETSFH